MAGKSWDSDCSRAAARGQARHGRVTRDDVEFLRHLGGVSVRPTSMTSKCLRARCRSALRSKGSRRTTATTRRARAQAQITILGFAVDDVDGECARIKALGAAWFLPPTTQPCGKRSMIFKDREGRKRARGEGGSASSSKWRGLRSPWAPTVPASRRLAACSTQLSPRLRVAPASGGAKRLGTPRNEGGQQCLQQAPGRSAADRSTERSQLTEAVGLEGLIDRPVATYSGGERR